MIASGFAFRQRRMIARFFLSAGSHGAGIDDIDIALFSKGRNGMPLTCEELLHCLGLILIDFTAQGAKTEDHRKYRQKRI